MLLPREVPCPSSKSSPQPTRFRVPKNAHEWLAFGIVMIGFIVLVLAILLLIYWLAGTL
jgi:uncharacterized RDD family membrane protein YckC